VNVRRSAAIAGSLVSVLFVRSVGATDDTAGLSNDNGDSSPTVSQETPAPTSVNSGATAEVGAKASTNPPSTAPSAPMVATGETPSKPDEIAQLKDEVSRLRADFESSQSTTDSADTYQRKIELYGFMDMGFQKLWAHSDAAILGTGTSRAATFVLGNINLYVDANPTQSWRALTEMRLTNYPNGSLDSPGVPALGQAEHRSSTLVNDVNAPDAGFNQVSWGSIVLEQAWIQGTATDWLGVRVGYWRTPFGIWNIDHGSPTLIGLTPPQFTGGRFYPQHQLGIQATGHVTTRAWTLNYTVYVSNGKTTGNSNIIANSKASDTLDPTNDKAFGFRLNAQTMRPFPMSFGVAGYTGRFSQQVTNSVATGLLAVSNSEVSAYRQWDIGTDASLDIGGLRFRTELAVERVNYEPGKLELFWNIPGHYWPNQTKWGWYTLSAYQLPWLGLEPYLSCELYRYPSPLSEAIVIPGVGLNIHFNTEVQIKTQFTRVHFFDFDGSADHSHQDLSMLASRLVIAY
jgi:hypothetical protein